MAVAVARARRSTRTSVSGCASTSPSRRPRRSRRRVGIVVDVVRATSSIAQALAAGYERVLCCREIEEANGAARASSATRPSSAASATAVVVEGFDVGASPREFAAGPLARTLILSTTNGTAAILTAAARCETVLVGSLLNLRAVAAAARAAGDDVAVLCAGFKGGFALDDAYCAGRIVQELGGERSDAAIAAALVAGSFPTALEGLNARTYGPPGLEADIEFCARENVLDTVPRFARMVGPAAEIVAPPSPAGARPRPRLGSGLRLRLATYAASLGLSRRCGSVRLRARRPAGPAGAAAGAAGAAGAAAAADEPPPARDGGEVATSRRPSFRARMNAATAITIESSGPIQAGRCAPVVAQEGDHGEVRSAAGERAETMPVGADGTLTSSIRTTSPDVERDAEQRRDRADPCHSVRPPDAAEPKSSEGCTARRVEARRRSRYSTADTVRPGPRAGSSSPAPCSSRGSPLRSWPEVEP